MEKRAPARRQDSKTPTAYLVSGNMSHPNAVIPNPKGFQAFRRPTKLSNCRIFKVLEARGDTQNLCEDHLGNYATGCPRYASLTTEEMYEVTKQANICLRCLDPKSTWVFRDGHKGCLVSKTKKNKFSCTNANFSWICVNHKDDNYSRGSPLIFLREVSHLCSTMRLLSPPAPQS